MSNKNGLESLASVFVEQPDNKFQNEQASKFFVKSVLLNLTLFVLLTLSLMSSNVFAQTSSSQTSTSKTGDVNSLLQDEIKTNQINPEFLRKYDRSSNALQPDGSTVQKQVRMIYLVPSDKFIREDYKAAMADAILHVQDFYQKELGNDYAFSLHSPIVEVYQTTHTSSYYQTHLSNPGSQQVSWFYENTLTDGFALTGGGFNDPNNRWIYYIDADPLCGQSIGGTSGIAVLSGNDFRGLTGEQNFPRCSAERVDMGDKYRWIGGLGHELGHAFTLPHPPGCGSSTQPPSYGCDGGVFALNSLMYVGYARYPNTYFLPADKQTLLNSGFFSQLNLNSGKFVDFDGDRSADISVWRPGNGGWYINRSSGTPDTPVPFGQSGDKIVPGDYDGDGKTDRAVWRPSDGNWYILRSSDNTVLIYNFGLSSDIPVAADYDGDRVTDIAIWRPSTTVWFINRSATNTLQTLQFGESGDKPVAADYNGDKRADIAVFRPSTNVWYIYNNYLSYYYANPQLNYSATQYGISGDKLVPGDYDGDKKADIAVWRPSSGIWFYLGTSSGASQATQFGQSGDVPAPADYDNDGKFDFAVWRPDTGIFYIRPSLTGAFQVTQWGQNLDVPVASAFVR